MRVPLEYGDNFPVPSGSWDPAVPWRFPKGYVQLKRPSLLTRSVPWLMLVFGGILGVLWMSWTLWSINVNKDVDSLQKQAENRMGAPVPSDQFSVGKTAGGSVSPKRRPVRTHSRLA